MSSALILLAAAAIPFALIVLARSSSQEATGAPPGPGPEQKKLEAWVGKWDAEVEMMGQSAKGVETCRMALGGFWLLYDFDGEFMGAPFQGHGMIGFDPSKQAVLSLWADSSGSPLSLAEGRFAPGGKQLVSESAGLDMQGNPARFKHVTTFEGADKRTFEIHQLVAGGREELAMRIRYTRRK